MQSAPVNYTLHITVNNTQSFNCLKVAFGKVISGSVLRFTFQYSLVLLSIGICNQNMGRIDVQKIKSHISICKKNPKSDAWHTWLFPISNISQHSCDFIPDVNECESGKDVCGNGECDNTIGSFLCRCEDGYSVKPGRGPQCSDDDECALDTHQCDINAHCINNPVGIYLFFFFY